MAVDFDYDDVEVNNHEREYIGKENVVMKRLSDFSELEIRKPRFKIPTPMIPKGTTRSSNHNLANRIYHVTQNH